jgi:hypothetical protein
VKWSCWRKRHAREGKKQGWACVGILEAHKKKPART